GATGVWAVRHAATAGPAPGTPPSRPRLVSVGYVEVDGGTVHLAPSQPGRVVEVLAREGDAVKAGAVLLRLDDQPARFALEQAEAAQAAAEAEAARARDAARQHPHRVAAQRAAVEAADRRGGPPPPPPDPPSEMAAGPPRA